MTASLDRLFTSLPGVWTVARTIEDGRFGAGRFEGEAVFTRQRRDALHYAEAGELSLGAWRGPAYRRWLHVGEPDALSIFYPDGQTLLHRFEFATGDTGAEHTHLCGEDQYRATLEVTGPAEFSLSYAVHGPAKRYSLNTIYAWR